MRRNFQGREKNFSTWRDIMAKDPEAEMRLEWQRVVWSPRTLRSTLTNLGLYLKWNDALSHPVEKRLKDQKSHNLQQNMAMKVRWAQYAKGPQKNSPNVNLVYQEMIFWESDFDPKTWWLRKQGGEITKDISHRRKTCNDLAKGERDTLGLQLCSGQCRGPRVEVWWAARDEVG